MYFQNDRLESKDKVIKNLNRVSEFKNVGFPFAPYSVLTKSYVVLCKVNRTWEKLQLCICAIVPKAEETFSSVILCVL